MLNAYSFVPERKFNEGQRKAISIIVSRAAALIENARLYENLKTTLRQTIQGFARAIEAMDKYTHGHSDRVTEYARLIAVNLGIKEEEIEIICQAALMHDIGKIGVHANLNKPGKLTHEEYEIFKQHPLHGKQIIEPISFLHELIPSIYYHHEKYDGSGYPEGLKGEEIPLAARILAVADTYDAMTSDRAYRKALPHDIAIAELQRCQGIQFDPKIVKIFVSNIESYRKECRKKGIPIPE